VNVKPYIATIIACALVMLMTIQPHAGFELIFVAIPLSIWALLSIVAVVRKPEQLKPRVIKFAFWLTTILIVLGVHWHYATDARRIADHYVLIIEQYKAGHGAYPPDLMTAGLDKELARRMMLGYGLTDGKPGLFYAATLVPFDTYDYDFQHHVWVYQPD